jgi:hypothetical protein
MVMWLCGCASSQPPAASSPAHVGTTTPAISKRFALVGQDGVLVEVVDFQDGKALLKVSGVEGPLQDKVVSHRREREGQDLRYITQSGGREWLTLLKSGTEAWVGTYWRLYLPGTEAISVAYSEDRSSKVDADSLFAAHEQQHSAGELDKLQSFDQRAERGREEEAVATSATAASRECESRLTAAIVWDTVDDQALREHGVADYCVSALRALKSVCYASPELKSFVQKQVKDVSCRFDGGGEMRLDAGHLTWSVNFALGDVDTLAGQALARIYQPQETAPAASNDSSRGTL